MSERECFERNVALFARRDPLLAFKFRLYAQNGACDREPPSLCDFSGCWKKSAIEEVDLLYIYGWEEGIYSPLSAWLDGKKGRRLILLEDDVRVAMRFLKRRGAYRMLQDDRIAWQFLEMDSEKEVKELIWSHSFVPSLFFALATESGEREARGNRFKVRFTELQMGVELTCSHYWDYGVSRMKNTMTNLLSGEKVKRGRDLMGAFKGIPAVICGAGPSLAHNIGVLPSLSHRTLIFGCGSALGPLGARGITPHFGISLDPNPPPQRLSRQKGFTIPFLYQSALSHTSFLHMYGDRFCFCGSEGFPLEEWLLQELDIDLPQMRFEVGWNVVTFATQVAHHLGCHPIILIGVDGCRVDGQAYVEKAQHVDERKEYWPKDSISLRDRFGNAVLSRADLLMGKRWLEEFAALNPNLHLINATEGGLHFEGVANRSLKGIGEMLTKSYDLSARVHRACAEVMPLSLSRDEVMERIGEIARSMEGCSAHCRRLLALYEQTFSSGSRMEGARALEEIELEDELFYQTVLSPLWRVWGPLMQKEEFLEQMRDPAFEKELQKTLFFQEISQRYMQLFSEVGVRWN